jgi:hypothetical protein
MLCGLIASLFIDRTAPQRKESANRAPLTADPELAPDA